MTIRTAATMTVEPSNLDEVVTIFETFIKDVREKDPGTLTYHYFVDDGDPVTIHVFEEYADAQAHLDHFANIDMAAVGRLIELVTLSEPHYYGDPSPEELEMLKDFGTIHYHRPLVSIDQPTRQV
jgi:quinol monooxygenase YgiN